MKIIMVNEYGNCFKVAENEKQLLDFERLGFKKYEAKESMPDNSVKEIEKPKPKSATKSTGKKAKAVKKNG